MKNLANKLPVHVWAITVSALLLVVLTGCAAMKANQLPEVTVEITDEAIQTPAEMPAGFVAVTFVDRRTEQNDGVPIIARLHEGVSMEEALAEGDPTAPPKASFLGGQLGRTIFQLEAATTSSSGPVRMIYHLPRLSSACRAAPTLQQRPRPICN